jgi:hypothetical protein
VRIESKFAYKTASEKHNVTEVNRKVRFTLWWISKWDHKLPCEFHINRKCVTAKHQSNKFTWNLPSASLFVYYYRGHCTFPFPPSSSRPFSSSPIFHNLDWLICHGTTWQPLLLFFVSFKVNFLLFSVFQGKKNKTAEPTRVYVRWASKKFFFLLFSLKFSVSSFDQKKNFSCCLFVELYCLMERGRFAEKSINPSIFLKSYREKGWRRSLNVSKDFWIQK